MSTSHQIYPTNTNGFNSYANTSFLYLKNNNARLQIVAGDLTNLENSILATATGWNFLYAEHGSEGSKTKPVNAMLVKSMENVKINFRTIYNNIPQSVMTIEDYIALNIANPDAGSSPRPALTEKPSIATFIIGSGLMRFVIRWNNETGRPSIPKNANVVRIYGKIINATDPLPTSIDDCDVVFESTKADFKHNFTQKNCGMRFVCFAQYINTSNDAKNSPISDMHICFIG